MTACFTLVEALGLDATFVAPMLTAQLLRKLRQPLSLPQGLSIVVLIGLSTGAVLAITTSLLSHPAVLILTLALLLYLSFYAHLRGAPSLVMLLIQISAVSLPVLAVASPASAVGFAGVLIVAGLVGVLTAWVAFEVFSGDATDTAPQAPADASDALSPREAARDALLNTLVLLPVLFGFLLVEMELAVVVLIVIVNLLRQHNPQQGQRAALGLILGNLIGGLAAAAYNLVLLNKPLPFFVTVCLAATLAFVGRIATAGPRAPIYVIALGTFILLLGLGMTPLPGGSGEAFITRLVNVLLASAYAVGAISVLEFWHVRPIHDTPIGPSAR